MAYDGNYLAGPEYFGGKNGMAVWTYTTTDSAATIAGAGYFSDAMPGTGIGAAGSRGLKKGDVVIVTQVGTLPDTSPSGVSVYVVSAVSAAGAATVIKTATA